MKDVKGKKEAVWTLTEMSLPKDRPKRQERMTSADSSGTSLQISPSVANFGGSLNASLQAFTEQAGFQPNQLPSLCNLFGDSQMFASPHDSVSAQRNKFYKNYERFTETDMNRAIDLSVGKGAQKRH